MKLTIERAALLRSLGHVQRVVERRNTIPILSNVLLKAKGDELALTATDMDLEIVETVAAEVARAGAATAPAHTLYDIVRKLPDGSQVEIDGGDGGMITLRSGRSQFKLGCLPVEDFPQMSGTDVSHSFTVAAGDLRTLIDRSRFAISTEETRYYLNGIYFHDVAAGGLLRAVATDGHRLAQAQIARPDGAKGMPGIIVPRKTVLEVVKLFEGVDGAVEVSLSAAKIRFAAGDLVLTSKLIDGTFPDYERVIPRNNDRKLELDTKSFAAAVDRVSTISQEKGRAVKLAIGGNKVILTVNNPDSGSAEEEVACAYEAEPMEIGFNSRYLLDVAGQMKSDGMELLLADAGSPTIVRDPTDEQALYVLMPMRV